MERWKDFIETTSLTSELVQKYMEIRLYLKELGHTEDSIKRIHRAPGKLWSLKNQFENIQEKLWNQLNDWGFNVAMPEFLLYINPKLSKIDELIPLNDGNYERDNSGDEDFE